MHSRLGKSKSKNGSVAVDQERRVSGAQFRRERLERRGVARPEHDRAGPVLDERFAAVDTLLENYRAGDGFKSYTELTQDDIKKMTDAVDALGEPVSQVAGVVSS